MPDDGYVNPDRKPYAGKYKWVPSTIPSAKEVAALGWLDLKHERGTFRNDYYVNSSASTNYTIIPNLNVGVGASYFGSPEWPINISFRRKQNPVPIVPPVPKKVLWVKSNTFWWQSEFDPIATKLSSATFEYSLLVNIDDDNLLDILFNSPVYGSQDDYQALLNYKKGATQSVSIDWTKYIFGQIKLFTSSDTEETATSFPKTTNDVETTTTDQLIYTISADIKEEDTFIVYRALPNENFLLVSPEEFSVDYDLNSIKFKNKQPNNTKIKLTLNKTPLVATGFYTNQKDLDSDLKTLTVHFDYDNSTFKDIKKLRFESFYTDGPQIKFSLKKILLFKVVSNPRVNINNTQLPCKILAYAFNINCNKSVPGITDYFPNDGNNPTFYVKMFHPEDISKARGFAHAINLRFFVPSFPIYSFNGITLTGNIAANDYWVVFVGPVRGKKTMNYFFTGEIIAGESRGGRLVRINDTNLNNNSSVYIQRVNSQTVPNEGSNWATIYTLTNTSSPPDGDFISPWLYHDTAGTSRSWYRLIKVDLQTGVSSITEPAKGLIYSEKSALKVETTGITSLDSVYIRRSVSLLDEIDPLDLEPLAYFTVDNIEDLFGSDILFSKGQWKFKLKAKSNDPNNQTNTHIFLRMWFHPGEEVINYNNPQQYRNVNTEIIFDKYNTDPSNTSDPKPSVRLKIGTPTSLQNCMVSPPLTSDFNIFEILRYADGLIKDSGTNNLYNSVFTSPTTKLVIGVYTFSYLQNATSLVDLNYNPPTVEIELNPVTTGLETTLLLNTNSTLSATRYYNFNRTNYIHFNTDSSNSLKLTRNLYEGGLVGIGNSYLPYDKKITAINIDEDPSGDSRVGLISFESGAGNFTNDDTLICIKHLNYSLLDDKSVSFFADFTTKGSSFQDGRLNPSTWSIGFQINKNIDNTRIPANYKIMAFFVDRYGTITERIFSSPYLKLSSSISSNATLVYTTEIKQPFFITGTDAQLIIRLIAYPYSANNQPLTDTELETISTALAGNPIGTRIKNFYLTINSTTSEPSGLTKLQVVDAVGFTGSTRFYEDLDLVPSSVLDSQQFWFYADKETLKAQIIANGSDFKIMGALYSPTWFLKLPKDIEVSVIGGLIFNSVFPYALKIRTVLDDAVTAITEDNIKAIESRLASSVYIAAKGEQESGSDISDVTRTLRLNDPLSTSSWDGLLAGQNSDQRTLFSGEDAQIFTVDLSESSNSTNYALGVVSEIQNTDGNKINFCMNVEGGELDTWIGPNASLVDNSFSSSRLVALKMTKVDAKYWALDGFLYILGIVSPGALMLRKVNIFNAGTDETVAPGINYLIDGPTDISETIDFIDEDIIYSENLSGSIVLETRPSIVVTNLGYILIAYVTEGSVNKIKAKILTSGFDEIIYDLDIVDMAYSNLGSPETAVYCPVLAYDNNFDISYCAFWCGGKIFLSKIITSDLNSSYVLGNIYLIAGNRDFTSGDNSANLFFKSLLDSGYLFVDQEGDIEEDLHKQSVGMYVSKNSEHVSELFIYYKDKNEVTSDIYARKFYSDGTVSERFKIS